MTPLKNYFISMMLLIAMPLCAQDDPGDDPDVPFDGGLSLLIAGGITYGIKKTYDARKKKHIRKDP